MEPVVECERVAISDHVREPSAVLIVDDHQDKDHLLSCILQKTIFSILEAENRRIAPSTLKDLQPDVALLDVLMPDIEGVEIFRRIKGNAKIAESPVLFVTVWDQDSESCSQGNHGMTEECAS
jgi:DNA-binding response OmpR family regulator